MGLARLGKRKHTIFRDSRTNDTSAGNAQGYYVDGEWVEPTYKKISICMNVQANFSSFMTKKLPVGDREKEAIWFSSDEWLYTADSGKHPHKADILFYRGMYWEVRACNYYGNFGTHCEGIAIKINKDPQGFRLEGELDVIRESDYPSTQDSQP